MSLCFRESVTFDKASKQRLRDRSWHQSSITEVLQENIVAYYDSSWKTFPGVLEIAFIDEHIFFCLLTIEDPTIRMYCCTISWSFAHSEHAWLLHTRMYGTYNKTRGVGDDFCLDFLLAWRLGTSLVLGSSVFVTCELGDDIWWYPEMPTHSLHSAWKMHGIFNLVGPFSTQRCAPGRLVLREVFHVVSSNMAAAETCLPSSGSFKLKLRHEENPGYLLYIGDSTTQLYRDYNKPL